MANDWLMSPLIQNLIDLMMLTCRAAAGLSDVKVTDLEEEDDDTGLQSVLTIFLSILCTCVGRSIYK